MYCLTSIVVCDSQRSDQPKVPESLCHMIAFWMHELDIKTVEFSLDEVSDHEQ